MCGCSAHATEATATAAAGALVFSVPDMTCGHCVGAITAAFAEKLPGVPVEIDLAGKTVRVAAPSDVATAIIADAGYSSQPV
jgi:copper chaperone